MFSGVNTMALVIFALRAGRWTGTVDTRMNTMGEEVSRARDKIYELTQKVTTVSAQIEEREQRFRRSDS